MATTHQLANSQIPKSKGWSDAAILYFANFNTSLGFMHKAKDSNVNRWHSTEGSQNSSGQIPPKN